MATPDFTTPTDHTKIVKHLLFKDDFDELATDGAIGDPGGAPAFGYIRVSSDEQGNSGRSGFQRQIEKIHEVALETGYRVSWDMLYADDYSGFVYINRPALTQLRRTYKQEARRADAILFENPDRLSRTGYMLETLLVEMQNYRIAAIFQDAPEDEFTLGIVARVNEKLMKDTLRRMHFGKLKKARDGKVTAPRAAFGYKRVDSSGNQGAKLAKDTNYGIDETQAPVVVEIFTRLARGEVLNHIADVLNERGVPTAKSAEKWTQTVVRNVIVNEVYKGSFHAHKWTQSKVWTIDKHGVEREMWKRRQRPREEWIHVPVPAIVTPELWQAANDMLKKNQQMARRHQKHDYLLSGLLICADCRSAYCGMVSRGQYRYYRCGRRNKRRSTDPAHLCTQGHFNAETLERSVWKLVERAIYDKDLWLKALDQRVYSQANLELVEDIESLEKTIASKDNEDERLYRAYMAGVFDENEYASRRKLLKAEQGRIQTECMQLKGRLVTEAQFLAEKAEIMDMMESFHALIQAFDPGFEFKRDLLKRFVSRIVVNAREGTFTIEGRIVHFDDATVSIDSIYSCENRGHTGASGS